jgi:excisionase family DNA binding protein
LDKFTGEGVSMEKLMTAKELSQFLKLSESTIYKLVSSGEIPGFKIGDSWRFELEEIRNLIRESKKIAKRQRDPVEEREEKNRLAQRGQ